MMRTSYWLMLGAVVLRLAAISPGLPTAAANALLHLAAAAWISALALYLWQFVPMLIRPRLSRAGLCDSSHIQLGLAGCPIHTSNTNP
jgi:uncharacterized protein involved in response to NO